MSQSLTFDAKKVQPAITRCREKNVRIPTFEEQRHPEKIPDTITTQLKKVGPKDVNPLNLYRITWKNDPVTGGFHGVNFVELPSSLTGVKARIFGLVGKYFPTGAHKVGASFGCLVPRLVTGTFDPTRQKAVWPSTGNYCRGGAYNSQLLGCQAIAILPEEMSQERFDWLKNIGSEVIATPGCESNVKEIYDKCWELKEKHGDDIVVLNQFEEFGNGMWHYNITADAIKEVLDQAMGPNDRLAAYLSATGSAGTIAAGDRLKEWYPQTKTIASEALQCPTLIYNGYGAHRIEGIGDKHIPWIHNVRNTDALMAIDDEACIQIMRLFNEDSGREFLKKKGVAQETIDQLELLGISSISNMLSAIKAAKYFELTENDCLFTIFTDSMGMYESRMEEERVKDGAFESEDVHRAAHHYLWGADADHFQELNYRDKKRVHNLKYFTWIEQQGKEIEELNAQWRDPSYWTNHFRMADQYDELIRQFNIATGLSK